MDICKDHGIEFIGPRSEHIRIMGDKSTARDTMKVCDAAATRCSHSYYVVADVVSGTRSLHTTFCV